MKHKVAILDMQPIMPAVGGGRLRLLGLYHALGPHIEAKYVGTYDWPGEPYRKQQVSDSLEELIIPLSAEHHEAARELSVRANGKTVIDIAFAAQAHLSEQYLAAARETIEWADVVVFSHPWVYPLMHNYLRTDQLVVYDSHNVEGLLRAQLLEEANPIEATLLRGVVEAEYNVGSRADLIFTCSQNDLWAFERLYDWEKSRMHVIPNGVMSAIISPADPEQKRFARAHLGVATTQVVAMFLGSNYPPNVEAAKFISDELALAAPDVLFVIAGSVGNQLKRSELKNIRITGFLDDAARADWLRASDLALNPMFSGSGTNIKMFDFMAAGLPILSTPIGARGITAVSGGGLWLADGSSFSGELQRLLARSHQFSELGSQNRLWVEDEFSWEKISPQVGTLIESARAGQLAASGSCASNQTLKLAHVSSVGHKCGVGEYTARLIETLGAMGVENYVATAATNRWRPNLVRMGLEGEVAWHYDDETWSSSHIDPCLVERLIGWGADFVLVQYHPGFMLGGVLLSFVQRCMGLGMKVGVVIHNMALIDRDMLRELSGTGCQLVVHSTREQRDAAEEGVSVQHIPLIVPSTITAHPKSVAGRDWKHHPPHIATTGFLRHHKGIPELVAAAALLRESYPGLRLLIQCALFPSPDSIEEHSKCLAEIAALGLQQSVVVDHRFLPIKDVYDALANADLAILPYHESEEGSSAAAATCLAAGLPLVVSKSTVFAELTEAAHVLQSNAPESIASTIQSLLNSPSRYDALATRCWVYSNEHSASKVATQYLKLVQNALSRQFECNA